MIRERIGAARYPLGLLEALVHRLRRWRKPVPDGVVSIEFDGQRMRGNPAYGGILGEIYSKGYHEFAATQCMKRAVRAGMTVLDVGADKGYNTLLAARRVGDRGRVHAFEPLDGARAQLEENVRLNGYANVTVHDVALFDEEKRLAVEHSRLAGESSSGGVRCVPFDVLRRERPLGEIGFVKIDVEGAELNVLRGMRETLAADLPDLLIEVHPRGLAAFGHSVSELTELLAGLGYRWAPLMITRGLMREIVSGKSLFKCRLYCRRRR